MRLRPIRFFFHDVDGGARGYVRRCAEATDAASSVAAECVMLNKGPFVDEAVRLLSDILRRMEKHHDKKRSLFRKLRVSTFAETLAAPAPKDARLPA
jgi:pyruvate kinase